MTSIIKFDSKRSIGAVLRDFETSSINRSSVASDNQEQNSIEPVMQAEVEALKREIESLNAELEREKAASFSAGENAAKSAFERDETLALEALETGISGALTSLKRTYDILESSALLLSHAALQNLFLDKSANAAIVSAFIKGHAQTLRKEAILEVQVSEHDFPDQAALRLLASDMDMNEANLNSSHTLKPGDCVMTLRLGKLELSISDYLDGIGELAAETATGRSAQ